MPSFFNPDAQPGGPPPTLAQPAPGQPAPASTPASTERFSPFGTNSQGGVRLDADTLRGLPERQGFFGEKMTNMMARNQVIRDFGASHLRSSLARTREQRGQFSKLSTRQAANIGGQQDRMRRTLGKTASLHAARQGGTPTSFAGSIQDATRRAGARQGIVNRGEKAIANQSLKDRLSFVRSGMRQQGVAQQALSQGAHIREGVNIGVTDANEAINASNNALLGTAVGGLTGLALDPQFRQGFTNPGQVSAAPGGPLNTIPHPGTG